MDRSTHCPLSPGRALTGLPSFSRASQGLPRHGTWVPMTTVPLESSGSSHSPLTPQAPRPPPPSRDDHPRATQHSLQTHECSPHLLPLHYSLPTPYGSAGNSHHPHFPQLPPQGCPSVVGSQHERTCLGARSPAPPLTQITFATFPAPDTESQASPLLLPAWDTVP